MLDRLRIATLPLVAACALAVAQQGCSSHASDDVVDPAAPDGAKDAGAWHGDTDAGAAVGSDDAAGGADAPGDASGDGADAGDGGAGGKGGPPLVVLPIAGATRGKWEAGSIHRTPYQMLLPSGYDTTHAYPVILYLHQLDNASQIPNQIDPWFNDLGFRSQFPAIVVAPQCIMDADPSGQTINWGGVSQDRQACQDDAIALVDQVLATKSAYPGKVYVTGNSMGGIGSWDIIIKYNTKSPTVRPLFAATLILAGATYDHGYPTPDPAIVSRLKDVPIWAIHGGQDHQVPLEWDKNTFAAEQAAGGAMRLLVDDNEAHDVWDTYYVMPKAQTYWSWLFSQGK